MSGPYAAAARLYELMEEESNVNEHEERLYEGHITKLARQVSGATKLYAEIRKLLLSPVSDPCIEIRQRGNASQPTVILLNHPPPEEWAGIAPRDLTAPVLSATLAAEHDGRISKLEIWRETLGGMNIAEVLKDFESRIRTLEGRE